MNRKNPAYLVIPIFLLLMNVGLSCVAFDIPFGRETENYQALENDIKKSSADPSDHFLNGQVTDRLTGQALPATLHPLENGRNPERMTISADTDGFFQTPLSDQLTQIRVEMPGYHSQIITPTASAAGSADVAVTLAPRLITGTLRAADTGSPLTGVTLEVGGDTPPQAITTRAEGTFELSRVSATDSLSVQPPTGYLPLEITLGESAVLSLTLAPRLLTVTVQNTFDGSPLSDVDVIFAGSLTETTNLEGQATFSHIPAAGDISIEQSGFVSATIPYDGATEMDVALVPAGVRGVVRDQGTGDFLPQATLYLGDEIFQADERGVFTVTQLLEAPQPLLVKAAGYHRAHARLAQTGVFTDFEAPFSGIEGRWLATAPCSNRKMAQSSDMPCLDFLLEPFAVKAIYIPFHYLGGRELMISYLDFVAETELNAIVVDVKGDFGFIGWQSDVELVAEIEADEWRQPYWMPLDELVAEARKRNVYSIARLVIFKDDPLARNKPEWATVREDGSAWIDGEGLGWANPFKEEVWDYNIALAKEVAAFGFDELNLDYIRFPSDGDVGAIVYGEENTLDTRTATIGEFMRRMRAELQPTGVFLSADVFGLTVWVEPESDMNIGQRVIDIAPHIDYLAPMIYPSTFIPGNLGYDDPAAEPYGVIFNSQNEAETRVPPHVKVRPWLQAYWYSVEEMQLQRQGADDAGSVGWAWWNAGGQYDEALFERGGPEK